MVEVQPSQLHCSVACLITFSKPCNLLNTLFVNQSFYKPSKICRVKPEFLGPKETVDLIHKEGLNFVQVVSVWCGKIIGKTHLVFALFKRGATKWLKLWLPLPRMQV